MKGRDEQALKSLRSFREGCFSEENINRELDALRVVLQEQPEKGVFSDMWKGLNLKRSAIAIGVNFFLHATGQTFAWLVPRSEKTWVGLIDPWSYSHSLPLTFLLSLSYTDLCPSEAPLCFGSALHAQFERR